MLTLPALPNPKVLAMIAPLLAIDKASAETVTLPALPALAGATPEAASVLLENQAAVDDRDSPGLDRYVAYIPGAPGLGICCNADSEPAAGSTSTVS